MKLRWWLSSEAHDIREESLPAIQTYLSVSYRSQAQLPRPGSLDASPLASFTLCYGTHLEHLPHSSCVGNQIHMVIELDGESLEYLGQDKVMRIGPF